MRTQLEDLQNGLVTNALDHLGVVGAGRPLSDGNALKGVRLHGSSNSSHGTEERELAAGGGAGDDAGGEGRHDDEWCGCFFGCK